MLYQNLHVFSRYFRVIDAGILAAGLFVLRWVDLPEGVWTAIPVRRILLCAGVLAASFVVLAGRLHVYHVRRTETPWTEFFALLETSVLAVAATCLVAEVAGLALPAGGYAAVAVGGTGLLVGSRLLVRMTLRRMRRQGFDHRSWLLVGRNERSAEIVRIVRSNPEYGIRLVGLMDIAGSGGSWQDRCAGDDPFQDLPLYEDCGPEATRSIMTREAVDAVVVTLPVRTFYEQVSMILRVCGAGGVPVMMPARMFEGAGNHSGWSTVGTVSLVTHHNGPPASPSLVVKRLIDIGVATGALLLLLPLIAGIAAAIKLTSKGPVFFRQVRVGLHGRKFRIVKFRTMVEHAAARGGVLRSDTDGPAFKMRRDPRVTPVGRVLRKYYLDEIPQLWNVFLGQMSLVGPRPLPVHEADSSEWWQRRRLSMPPGLTCLWQIRSDPRMPFARWMDLDLEYIDGWSLSLDFRLMLATVATVIRGSGW